MEPLLIKPNDDELLDIFGIKVSGGDDESVKGAMAELHAKGAKNVLLTLGGAGAYFSNGEHIWFANRTFDVKLLSTVCAGDSSLAAFLSVWHDAPERVEDALRLSMATGATWSSARAWATLPRWTNIRSTSRFVRSASRIENRCRTPALDLRGGCFLLAERIWRLLSRFMELTTRLRVRAFSFLVRLLENHRLTLTSAGGHRHVQCFAQR